MVKRTKSDTFITLDLTHHSAKVLGFNRDSEKVNLESVSESLVEYGKEIGMKNIKHAIAECETQSGNRYKHAILGLSGEHVFGFLLIVKSERKNPTKKISTKEIEHMYERIKEVAIKKAIAKWESNSAYVADLEILDLVVTSTLIDDQRIDEPVGLIGKSITMSVYCSFADKKHYEWATKIVAKTGVSIVETTTTLYTQSRVLAEECENFIIVDIGAMYTDIGVVFGKNLIETRSFDIGGTYFTKHLEKEKKLDFNKANAKKEAFADGTLPEDEVDQVGDILFDAGKTWVLSFKTILASLRDIKSFPTVIYLTGGSSNLTVIQELLYENGWLKEIPFLKEPDIKVVDSSILETFVDDKIKAVQSARLFPTASLSVVKKELI